MKKIFLLVAVLFVLLNAQGQAGDGQRSYLIKGTVMDALTNKPLQYATISVFSHVSNTLLTGGLTDDEGQFSIRVVSEDVYLEIGYLGYLTEQVSSLSFKEDVADLGLVAVNPDEKVLEELVVTGERSQTTFQLDKRVFSVGKDLSSAGGNAMDILANVPSVDVNIEGEVSLRGNTNVQILVNGKPSVIASGNALASITADMIEQVEVITNPSAKYDSEGTTGILNIILKKEERKGINGSVTLNTGHPNNHSLGLSLNKRTEKLNVFSQFGVGKRTFISEFTGRTTDRSDGGFSDLIDFGDGEKNERFVNLILGADFYLNPSNVITLSGHYGLELEDEFSNTNFELFNASGDVNSRSLRSEVTDAVNPKWQYELQYKRSYPDHEDHALLASATGSFFGKDQNSAFQNSTFQGDLVDFQQDITNNFSDVDYNFQVDYTHPFTERRILEVGAKYNINDNRRDYTVEDLIDNVWITNANFTNNYQFDQYILGVYSTYALEWERWSFKAGLRIENTYIRTELIGTNSIITQRYTNPFPTLHTSYKVNNSLSMQAGYSRRISRPWGGELNPFAFLRNNLNLRTGNPELLPEFTDSFELSSIKDWQNGSVNVTMFYRKTADVVDRIIQVVDSLSISTPQNVGISNNTGVEINGQIEPLKWLSILADFNWIYFERVGVFESQQFDFTNSWWNSRITTKFKFKNDLTGELRLRHQSGIQRLQSVDQERIWVDVGLKKKLAKGRAVINISVRDVFSSRRFINVADQQDFFRSSDRLRNGSQIVFGISYGFGKGDAMEFSGHKQF